MSAAMSRSGREQQDDGGVQPGSNLRVQLHDEAMAMAMGSDSPDMGVRRWASPQPLEQPCLEEEDGNRLPGGSALGRYLRGGLPTDTASPMAILSDRGGEGDDSRLSCLRTEDDSCLVGLRRGGERGEQGGMTMMMMPSPSDEGSERREERDAGRLSCLVSPLTRLSPPCQSRTPSLRTALGHMGRAGDAESGALDEREFEELAASVERLRLQRQQVEVIKREGIRKDAMIRRLQDQLTSLRNEVEALKEAERQAMQTEAEMSSLREEARAAREAVREKCRAMDKAAEAWAVKEKLYKESVWRLKQEVDGLIRKFGAEVEEQSLRVEQVQREALAQARAHETDKAKLQSIISRQEASLSSLQAELQVVRQDSHRRLSEERAAAQARVEEVLTAAQSREREAGDLRVRVTLLEEELHEARSKTEQAQAKMESLSARASEAEARAERQARDRQQLKAKVCSLEEEVQQARSARAFLHNIEAKVDGLERELSRKSKENTELRRAVADKDEKISSLKQSCETKAELKLQLKELKEQLEGERDDRRRAAQARAALLAQFSEAEGQLQATLDQAGLPSIPSDPHAYPHRRSPSPPRTKHRSPSPTRSPRRQDRGVNLDRYARAPASKPSSSSHHHYHHVASPGPLPAHHRRSRTASTDAVSSSSPRPSSSRATHHHKERGRSSRAASNTAASESRRYTTASTATSGSPSSKRRSGPDVRPYSSPSLTTSERYRQYLRP